MALRNKKNAGKRKKLVRTSIECKNPSPSCAVGTELQNVEKNSSSLNTLNDGFSSPSANDCSEPPIGRRLSQRRLSAIKNNSSVVGNDPQKLEQIHSVVLDESSSNIGVKNESPQRSKLSVSPETEKTNLDKICHAVETGSLSPQCKRTTRLSLRNNQAALEKNGDNTLSKITSNARPPCSKRGGRRQKSDIQVENKFTEGTLKDDASPVNDLIPESSSFTGINSGDCDKIVPKVKRNNLSPVTVSTSISKTEGEIKTCSPFKKDDHISEVVALKDSTFKCNKCSGTLSKLSVSETQVDEYLGIGRSTAEKGIMTQNSSIVTDQFTQTVNCLSMSTVKTWDIVKRPNLVNSCSTQTHNFGKNKGVQSCVEIKDQGTQINSEKDPKPKNIDFKDTIHVSNKDELSDLMLELIENLRKESFVECQETITEKTKISPHYPEDVSKVSLEDTEKTKLKKSSHHHRPEKKVSGDGVSKRKSRSSPEKVLQDSSQLKMKEMCSSNNILYECSVVINKLKLTASHTKLGELCKSDKTFSAFSYSKNKPIAQSGDVSSLPSISNSSNTCNSSTFLLEQDVLAKKVTENGKNHGNSDKKGTLVSGKSLKEKTDKKGTLVSGKSLKEKTDDKLKSRNNKTSAHKDKKRYPSSEKKDKKRCDSDGKPISLEMKSNLTMGSDDVANDKLSVEGNGKEYSVKNRKVEDKSYMDALHSSKHKTRHEKNSLRREVRKIEGNQSSSKCVEERVQEKNAESIDCQPVPDVTKVKIEVEDVYPLDDDDVIIYDDTYMNEIEEMIGGTESNSKHADCNEFKKDLLQSDIVGLNEKNSHMIPTDNKSEKSSVTKTVNQKELIKNQEGAVLRVTIKNVLKSPKSVTSEAKKKVTFKDISKSSVNFEDKLLSVECKHDTEKVIINAVDGDLELKMDMPIEMEKIKDEESEDEIPELKMENKSVGFADVTKESSKPSLEDGEIMEKAVDEIDREDDSVCLSDKPTGIPKTCVADVSYGVTPKENKKMCPGDTSKDSSRKYAAGDPVYEVSRENVHLAVSSTETSREDLAVDCFNKMPVDTKSTGLVEPSKEPSKECEPVVPYKIPRVSLTGSDVLVRNNEKRKPSEATAELFPKDKNCHEGVVENQNSVKDTEITSFPTGNFIEKEKTQSTSKSCVPLLGNPEKILQPELEKKLIENDRNLLLPNIFRGICFKFLRGGCSCLKFRHQYPPGLMHFMENTNSWDIYTTLHFAIVKKFKKFLQEYAANIVGILADRKEANLFLDFIKEYRVNFKGTVEFWNAILIHLIKFDNINEFIVSDILKFVISEILHKYHVRQIMLNSMLEKIVVISCSFRDTLLFSEMLKFLYNDKILFSKSTLELLLKRCLSVMSTSEKDEVFQITGNILCSGEYKTPILPSTVSLMMQLIDLLGRNSQGLLAERLRNKIDCKVPPVTEIVYTNPVQDGMCEQKPNSFESNENSYKVESVEPQGRNRISLKRRSLHSDYCPPTKKPLVNNCDLEHFDSVYRFPSSNSPIGVPTCQSNFSESVIPVPLVQVCVNQTIDYDPSQGLVSAPTKNPILPQVWSQENLSETVNKPCDSGNNGSSSDNTTYSIPILVSRQVDYNRTPFCGKKVTKNRNGGDSFLKVCHTASMPNQLNEDNVSPSYQSESPMTHRNVPKHSKQEERQGFFPENNIQNVSQITGQTNAAGYCDLENTVMDYNKKNNSMDSNSLIRIHPQDNLKTVEPVLAQISPNEGSSLICVSDQKISKNAPVTYNSSPVNSLTELKKIVCAPPMVNDLEAMVHQCCWTVPALSTFFGPWTSRVELESKLARKLCGILEQDFPAAVYTMDSLLKFMRTKEFLQMKISASIKRVIEMVIFNLILRMVILDFWDEAHQFLCMASSSNLSIMFSEAFIEEEMSISRKILVLSEICFRTNDMDGAIEYLKKGNLFGSSTNDWKYDSLEGDLDIQVTLISSLISRLATEGYSEMAPNTFLNVYRSQKSLLEPVDLLAHVNKVTVCALNGSCIDHAYEVYQTLTDELCFLPKSTLRALMITLISEKRIHVARELYQNIRHIGIYPEFKHLDQYGFYEVYVHKDSNEKELLHLLEYKSTFSKIMAQKRTPRSYIGRRCLMQENDLFSEILLFSYWQKEEVFIVLDNALSIMCNNLVKNPQKPNFIKEDAIVTIRVKVCAIPEDMNVSWTSVKEDNDEDSDPIPNRLALPTNSLKDTHNKITFVLTEMIIPPLQFDSKIIKDNIEELFTLNPFSLMNHLYKRHYCGIDFNEKNSS